MQEPAGGTEAALGDSITAGSPLWDPDPRVRDLIDDRLDERSQLEFWAERADAGLRFRNCGVFSERTDQIALRIRTCAEGIEGPTVQGGINDIAQGRPVADAAADLEEMIEEGKALGIPVALADVLPRNNGFPEAADEIDELNRRIREIAERQDVSLLRFNRTLRARQEPGLKYLRLAHHVPAADRRRE